MMTTAWLGTVTIEIDGCKITQDCYGTSEESILLIDSKSYHCITEVVESWSCR